MERIFELYDRISLALVDRVLIVNEPTIKEEINGSYTLDFEIDYRDRGKLNPNVLVKSDDQYFQIARMVKSRYDTITLAVSCEHVSYEMIIEGTLEEQIEYETTASSMIEEILQGTRFSLGSAFGTDTKYYYTTDLNKRKRLFDVANLFGGELIFDNFTVSLVYQRGTDKGVDIKLGVNLLGVTEERDFLEGRTSYELDLVDLSKIEGYKNEFSTVEIGDTISIIDGKLGIHSNERVLSIEYDPFRKSLPSVTVGDYARQFTEYVKEEEEKEEEKEEDIASLFNQFKVGGIDVLKKAGDITNDVIDFLTNKYSYTVEASADYNVLKNELVGIIAEKNGNSNSILSVIQTKENESGLLISTITVITSPNQLNNVSIKSTESIILVLSDKPLNDYNENSTDTELLKIKALGIRITFDTSDGVFLEEFSIGKMSLLGAENNDATESVKKYIENHVMPPISSSEIEIEENLKGLIVVPSEEYLKWHLTLLHCVGVKAGDGVSWTTEVLDLPLADYANFEVVTYDADSVVAVISNEPFSTIQDGTATEDAYYKAFGAKFVTVKEEDEADQYMSEFRLGDVDMLPIVSEETEQVRSFIKGETNSVVASAVYEVEEPLIGVFAALKSEYESHHLYIVPGLSNVENTHATEIIPWADIRDYVTTTPAPSTPEEDAGFSFTFIITEEPIENITGENVEEQFIKAFGVTVSFAGGPSDAGLYLDQFDAGDVDMIPFLSDETEQAKEYFSGNLSEVEASARYETSEPLYGIFVQLKSEFQNHHLSFLNTYSESDGYRETDAFTLNEVSEWLGDTRVPYQGNDESWIVVITDVPISEVSAQNINDIFIKAFGVTVTTGEEGSSGEGTYLEYGVLNYPDESVLIFEHGPYNQVLSITTGISTGPGDPNDYNSYTQPTHETRNGGVYQHITVSTSPIMEGGQFVGISVDAYMDGGNLPMSMRDYYGDPILISVQAICNNDAPSNEQVG